MDDFEFALPERTNQAVDVSQVDIGGRKAWLVRHLRNPNFEVFSPRERSILEELAKKYKTHTGTQLMEITHSENHAWDRTWQEGQGAYRKIEYTLAVPEDRYEKIVALANEHREFEEMLRG